MDQIDNIPEDFDNLQKHAPVLFGIDKKNVFTIPENYFSDTAHIIAAEAVIRRYNFSEAFKVPDNYFNDFPQVVLSQLKLSGTSNSTSFAGPGEDYFTSLPEKLLLKVKQTDIEKPKVEKAATKIIQLHYKKIALAASLLLIACLTGWFMKQQQPLSYDKAALNTLTKADIKAYLETNIDDNTLIEYVANNGAASVETDVEKKEILNYLIENTDDYKNEINEL